MDEFRQIVRSWNWDALRVGLVDEGRYSEAEIVVMRAECDRRNTAGSPQEERTRDLRCLRCDVQLTYAGTKKFHEGTRWGALGDFSELFVNKEKFDVYFCPRCGKVEFFVDGVGENLRPQ